MPANRSANEVVTRLRNMVYGMESGSPAQAGPRFSTGSAALDRLLPSQGIRRGSLLEWLGETEASGAATLALLAAREAIRRRGRLVVIDPRQMFYPPAATAWGIDPARLLVLHPAGRRDFSWALDQTLRSPAVAAVWTWLEVLDPHTARRLALAAEESGGVGLFVRPGAARREPSWAEERLFVQPLRCAEFHGPAWQVEAARSRHLGRGGAVRLRADEQGMLHEIDHHETHPLSLGPRLAGAATLPEAAGTPR